MAKKLNHFSIDIHIDEDGHERSFNVEGYWVPGYPGTYYDPPEYPYFEINKVWQYGFDMKSLEPVSDEFAEKFIEDHMDEIQELASERVEEMEREYRSRYDW